MLSTARSFAITCLWTLEFLQLLVGVSLKLLLRFFLLESLLA